MRSQARRQGANRVLNLELECDRRGGPIIGSDWRKLEHVLCAACSPGHSIQPDTGRTTHRPACQPHRRARRGACRYRRQRPGGRKPRREPVGAVPPLAEDRPDDGLGQPRHRQCIAGGAIDHVRSRRRDRSVAQRGGYGRQAHRRTRRSGRPHRGPARRRRLGPVAGCKSFRLDRGDCEADQPAGAQCHDRGGARRNRRPRLCRGRERSEEPRGGNSPGHAADFRYHARSRRPDRQPDRREQRRLTPRQERR